MLKISHVCSPSDGWCNLYAFLDYKSVFEVYEKNEKINQWNNDYCKEYKEIDYLMC